MPTSLPRHDYLTKAEAASMQAAFVVALCHGGGRLLPLALDRAWDHLALPAPGNTGGPNRVGVNPLFPNGSLPKK